jgi:uncharacterized BrkB/YihY/UPF0761 family membrane protein
MSETQNCSILSKKWYECPIPLTIFIIFIFLFVYSLVILVDCTAIITDPNYSEEKYGKTIQEMFNVYIINMIVSFLSLMVVLFYLYRILPDEYVEGVFNDYVGIIFSIYILIVSSWTINLFSGAQNVPKSEINIFSGIALVVSLLSIILFIAKIYLSSQIAKQQNINIKDVSLKKIAKKLFPSNQK